MKEAGRRGGFHIRTPSASLILLCSQNDFSQWNSALFSLEKKSRSVIQVKLRDKSSRVATLTTNSKFQQSDIILYGSIFDHYYRSVVVILDHSWHKTAGRKKLKAVDCLEDITLLILCSELGSGWTSV